MNNLITNVNELLLTIRIRLDNLIHINNNNTIKATMNAVNCFK